MLPVYAAMLSKTEFGIFDYAIAVGAFVTVILTFEISQAVIRFASEFNENCREQLEYIANGVWFSVICYVVLILLCSMFLKQLSYIFTGEPSNKLLSMFIVISYCTTSFVYLISVVYRAQLNAKASSITAISSGFLVASFTAISLFHTEMDLVGVFLSIILGQLIVIMINLFYSRTLFFVQLKKSRMVEMLRFSFPLVFSSIGVLLATLVDRIMIKELMSFNDVAVYGVAARFASVLLIITMGVQGALSPLIYNNIKSRNLISNIQLIFCAYVLVGLFIVFLLNQSSEFFVNLVVGGAYGEASSLIPIIAAAVLLNGGVVFFPGLSIVKKTKHLASITLFIGVLNILLNYIFIIEYGMIGAAYSTLFASFVYLSVIAITSERYFPVFKFSR